MAINVLGALAGANKALAANQLGLATGKRSIGSDEAGYMVARRAETSSRVHGSGSGNAADMQGILSVEIAVLEAMEADMIREQELAVAYNTGATTLSSDDLAAIEMEASAIANKWNDDQNATYAVNGYVMSDGSMDFSTVQLGEGSTVAGGASSHLFFGATASTFRAWADLWDASTLDRGADISGGAFAAATVAFDQGAIETALADIRQEITRLSGFSEQLDLNIAINDATAAANNAYASRNEDVDTAAATIAQTKLSILSQIATAQVAAANGASNNVLGLF